MTGDAATTGSRSRPRRRGLIAPHDRRVRVFVSSTLDELAAEREAAREAITALRLTPVMFELGARPHPPRELYRSYLAQSDVFVGVYGERYGWVAPGSEVSGLEDEYLLSGDLPRLLYVKTPAPEREPRLTALIERIWAESGASTTPYRDPADLGRLLADDLAVLLTERFDASRSRPAAAADLEPTPPPVPPMAMLGRERELEEVLELLRRPGVRLVTLLGPGGIGKTRMALEAAARLHAPVTRVRRPRAARGSGSWCRRRWPPRSASARRAAGRCSTSSPTGSGTARCCSCSTTSSTSLEAAPVASRLLAACPNLPPAGDQPQRAARPRGARGDASPARPRAGRGGVRGARPAGAAGSRARRGHPAGRAPGGFTSRRDPARDRARRRPGPAARRPRPWPGASTVAWT